ncbi:Ubiquitin ligase-binding protein [Wickerhamomyces ciferrii]|uniref:Ubiquitin ligase-binding protein n=1 Tax=Wickerhamomyces ciferrii (strain ATCC 14091 / BCRC 22168 / CBS 111 / JCM 3599 / NBRC 0793 / NRRL Y-1031 F-60-10) TaxID=1206466 RepID=K0KT72_WICCF|nr:Ubiquitin ligase-binding protein [Wickerhamomyces ciferrii]CCH46351.1 Ubiquitin ligase-binding protein [Wickerhamomyces ciferrii]
MPNNQNKEINSKVSVISNRSANSAPSINNGQSSNLHSQQHGQHYQQSLQNDDSLQSQLENYSLSEGRNGSSNSKREDVETAAATTATAATALKTNDIAPDYENDDYYHDDERIDYTNAYLRENKNSQEILSKLKGNITDFDKVQNGFSQWNYDDRMMDKFSKKQFVFDTLPSFEMLHSMQNVGPKSSFENPDNHDFPPDYFHHNHHARNLISNNVTGESSQNSAPSYASSTSSTGYFSSIADDSGSSTLSANDSRSASISAPEDLNNPLITEDFERNLIDKSHLLPNYDSFDVQVGVHVTKDVPHPHQKNELESMLKEYTSGDVVHGYVTLENSSDKPVHFQMFHVTLEGYVSIIDPIKKKQSIKRFLTMVDMSASWSYGCVSPAANLQYEAFSKDEEGYIIGLRNDRILAPKSKYKKFFAFKIPYKLLDTTCRHEQEIHTLLPPSFGVDRIKKKGKYAEIDINPILNYGHLGTRGSPILTRDLSGSNNSISYSINAKLIATHPKRPKKLCVIKEFEYHLRFIPFGFAVPLFSSKSALNNLTSQIDHGFEIANHVLKMKKENSNATLEDEEEFIRSLKNRQLSTVRSNSCSSISTTSGSSIRNSDVNFPLRNKNFGNADFSRVETHLQYLKNDSSNTRSSFLNSLKLGSSKKNTNESNGKQNGLINISTRIPKDGLPYISPNMLRKTNEISKLNEIGIQNIDNLSSSLSANEKKKLTSLKLNLSFIPSDFSSNSIDLPDLKNVKASLLSSNISSTSSIPLKLSADFFTENGAKNIKNKFNKFFENYNELSEDFKKLNLDIDRYIEPSLYRDMIAMKDLQVENSLVDSIDYSIKSQSNWSKNSSQSNEWIKQVELNLELKNDIAETLVPNFQTCLLSRVYCIKIEFKFKNGQDCELIVPIRLRCFNDDVN